MGTNISTYNTILSTPSLPVPCHPHPYAVEVTPDLSLQFIITGDSTANPGGSRCVMRICHPGVTNQHLAFKVKTTNVRRYLVRPNMGIVTPGCSETVSIILVDKHSRQLLWSIFERLGQSALDNSKDKFLVQSCEVDDAFLSQFRNKQRGEGGQYKKGLALGVDVVGELFGLAGGRAGGH